YFSLIPIGKRLCPSPKEQSSSLRISCIDKMVFTDIRLHVFSEIFRFFPGSRKNLGYAEIFYRFFYVSSIDKKISLIIYRFQHICQGLGKDCLFSVRPSAKPCPEADSYLLLCGSLTGG